MNDAKIEQELLAEIELLRKALWKIVHTYETNRHAEETMYYIAVSALEPPSQEEAA
jgi:hypothetical protein